MKTIAYYRESTNEQQIGISAQRTIVEQYAQSNNAQIVCEYVEHMSGKRNDRPILAQALEKAKAIGASLIVAKVDRLTRDASFGLAVCKSNDIVFCDHPQMGTLEMCIYFGMAQQEREYISQRTKQALQALKAQGKQLGKPNATWTEEQRNAALTARRNATKSNEANRKAWAIISLMQGTWAAKADYLNEQGFRTAKGGLWRGNQVQRLSNIMVQK